uniref:Uncharacterized protein n=1 Tax=Cannabis sativa TaxID=3483 RepID=A0A803Q8C0_CANSA
MALLSRFLSCFQVSSSRAVSDIVVENFKQKLGEGKSINKSANIKASKSPLTRGTIKVGTQFSHRAPKRITRNYSQTQKSFRVPALATCIGQNRRKLGCIRRHLIMVKTCQNSSKRPPLDAVMEEGASRAAGVHVKDGREGVAATKNPNKGTTAGNPETNDKNVREGHRDDQYTETYEEEDDDCNKDGYYKNSLYYKHDPNMVQRDALLVEQPSRTQKATIAFGLGCPSNPRSRATPKRWAMEVPRLRGCVDPQSDFVNQDGRTALSHSRDSWCTVDLQ